MQDLEAYLWATPNSRRVAILFEELGLQYRIHGVNIRARAQFAPEILALNPYGKIPIVTWTEAGGRQVLTESGAILVRFAERFDRFLPTQPAARDQTMAWLMVALTSIGPMIGQAHHWTELAPEKPDVAQRHHVGLVERAFRLLDGHLDGRAYLADDFSIADIAAFPWINEYRWAAVELADYRHLAAWHQRVATRPAVREAMTLPKGAKLQ